MSENPVPNQNSHSGSTLTDDLKERLHQWEAVCKQMESLPLQPGIDLAGEKKKLQDSLSALPELPPEYAELMNRKLQDAEKSIAFAISETARRDADFNKLKADGDALLAAGELATLKEVEGLEKRWQKLTAAYPETAAAAAEEAKRFAPLKERLSAEAAQEKERAEQAEKLAAELETLTAAEDIAPLHDNKQRIEEEYAKIGNVPADAAKRYNEAHKQASIKLARHYETLDLARWESFTLKMDICTKLEEISALPEKEMPAVARQLQEIREKWKSLGSVPKEKKEEINQRFLDLTRALQHKVDEFYSNRRQEQKQAAAEKRLLCEEAEKLAGSTDWGNSANSFKELQKKWKTLPGAGSAEHELFARFRAAADQFFNARSEHFAERDKVFKAAAEAKEAIIAQAENLAPNDVKTAKQLRQAFQSAAPAGRAERDLRQKFDSIMNNFFASFKEGFAQKEIRAKELVQELENLTADPAGNARAKEIREELRSLACRNTFAAERAAFDKFEKAMDAYRKQEKANMLGQLKTFAMSIALAMADDSLELPAEDDLAKFSKLRTAAKYIAAKRTGDAAAAEKLDKALAASRSEHERILSALEDKDSGQTEALSLAAELEAAILGNFASAQAAARKKESKADPRQLMTDYLNAGLLPAEELEESFRRFDAAWTAVSAGKK